MALPRFLQPYLASYDLKKLDGNHPFVRREIISQVLNLGDDRAVRWLFGNYTSEQIEEAVRNPGKGSWFGDSLRYWSKILEVDVPVGLYQRALVNFDPFNREYVSK